MAHGARLRGCALVTGHRSERGSVPSKQEPLEEACHIAPLPARRCARLIPRLAAWPRLQGVCRRGGAVRGRRCGAPPAGRHAVRCAGQPGGARRAPLPAAQPRRCALLRVQRRGRPAHVLEGSAAGAGLHAVPSIGSSSAASMLVPNYKPALLACKQFLCQAGQPCCTCLRLALPCGDGQCCRPPDHPPHPPACLPQQHLVVARTVLAACTRAVDYAGAMLNYVVVAAAVFAGEEGTAGRRHDAGDCAGHSRQDGATHLALCFSATLSPVLAWLREQCGPHSRQPKRSTRGGRQSRHSLHRVERAAPPRPRRPCCRHGRQRRRPDRPVCEQRLLCHPGSHLHRHRAARPVGPGAFLYCMCIFFDIYFFSALGRSLRGGYQLPCCIATVVKLYHPGGLLPGAACLCRASVLSVAGSCTQESGPGSCCRHKHTPPAPACPQMSRLGGLTARVGELLDALPPDDQTGDRRANCSVRSRGVASDQASGRAAGTAGLHAVRLSMDGRELQPSRFATMLQPPRMLRWGLGETHRLPPHVALPAPLRLVHRPAPEQWAVRGACTYRQVPCQPGRPAGPHACL